MRDAGQPDRSGAASHANANGAPAKSSYTTPQASAISLPKGGGAIHGIGEKFAANSVTGTGSMSIPIATSPGRSGFGPQLTLSYDSGVGNGPFGFGWSLSLPQITRKTDKGLPQYNDAEESDVFILSGAEDLVPVYQQDAQGNWEPEVVPDRIVDGVTYTIRRYRPRIEGLFARIERWTSELTGEIHWRSITRSNITTLYGKSNNSRIFDPDDPNPEHPTRIFSWLICESYDDKGNAIVYEYAAENDANIDLTQANERNRVRTANRYLKRIKYGNHAPYFPQLKEDKPWPTPPGNGNWFFEVVFDYGEHDPTNPRPGDSATWPVRNDPFSSYRSGFEVRTYRLCQRVLMFHHFPDEPALPGEPAVGSNCLVRSTDFTYSYEENPADARNPIFSYLRSVTQTGYKRQDAGGYLAKSLPPVEFTYSEAFIQPELRELDGDSLENLPIGLDGVGYQWIDLDGEGLSGILSEQAGAWFYKRNLSPINLVEDNGAAHVEARFGSVELVASQPALALANRAQFLDLAGDGRPDLVRFDGATPGFYERTTDEQWEPFVAFSSLPVVDWNDPNLKFIDLDGDGHADILISEDSAFSWHPSLGEEGFAAAQRVGQPWDEERGPRVVFADGTQSIYLADMCGDGLTDIARIRNGEVCYWPNLGYGRFGAKVTMDNAPWFDSQDLFDQRRIRLADIDGSGTNDILYLAHNGVQVYFNHSGNKWSRPSLIEHLPALDNLTGVQALDLLGNGTACLVWSSPLPGDTGRPLRYLELMHEKPHLLVKTVNNLGAETRVQYAPSTKFYLQDRLDGRPWITKLPFPVHCVERVETYDHISRNRFVTRYAYHHGYFDGPEREFRGFGMVEQWDTEEFATLAGGDQPEATNLDVASHVPPVLTRTWFHTGAYAEGSPISKQFAHEYYHEGDPSLGESPLSEEQFEAMLLPDTVLPGGLSAEEEREACRSLKGAILRLEIYALDQKEESDRPYSTSERNYTIKRLQPRGDNQHAVFFTHACETIDFHYERKLYDIDGRLRADPRVTHSVTLEVDPYGNVLKAVAIGYGRRFDDPDPMLITADRKKQKATLVTYTENRVTKSIEEDDDYRTPLPCETRTYELTGYTPTGAAGRFLSSDFVKLDFNDPQRPKLIHIFENEIEYEDESPGDKQRRLIEHIRTLYRSNDLAGPLSLGEVQSLALSFESYKLAFTRGLLANVYKRPVDIVQPPDSPPPENLLANPADVLGGQGADRGGYVDLDNDGQWWIPSGRIFYSPGSADTSAQELVRAREHFFLPHRYRDPFHTTAVSTETFVSYDAYDLLMLETRDALDNRVTVGERDADGNIAPGKPGNDYRVLQPRLVTDPNGNRAQAAFDALGLVAGTAVMGKPGENLGDTLDGFTVDLTQAQIDDFYDVEDPHLPAPDLLKGATTRIIYDLDRFRRTQQEHPDNAAQWLPVYAATLARETHVSDPLPPQGLKIQIGLSYSDGFGREIQKKIQAEPGPLVEGGPVVSPRWVGSGWTIFNNKGKPVRQYEPFFSQLEEKRHRFEFGVQVGVSHILFYDPVERVVATLHPNHTWEKVVFDPWRQATYDVNDTVLNADGSTDPKSDQDVMGFFSRLPDADYLPTWYEQRIALAANDPERVAADRAAVHRQTPTVAHFDSLGRAFLTIAQNRFERTQSDNNVATIEEQYATRVALDIESNQREVIDAKDRIVMRYHYDMLGNRIHQASMEAGERWMLNDVMGKPIRAWDSREHQFRTTYDQLRRPSESFMREGAGPELLVGRTVYGEALPNPEANNLRGKVVQGFDQAGVVTSEAYDFKGNLWRSQRQLAQEYKTTLDWATALPLEDEVFASSTIYDALNRPTELTAPHTPAMQPSVIRPSYNEANLLERVAANLRGAAEATPFVTNIDYNAKGQRVLIAYGNGVTTSYEYEPATFRLSHLQTLRGNQALQDLRYTYDPVGNITQIRDDAQEQVFHSQACVLPGGEYRYDALYRLIAASGREHKGDGRQVDWDDSPRMGNPPPNDCQALQNYVEIYGYDAVGNIMQMAHHRGRDLDQPGQVIWNRRYSYSTISNRLLGTSVPSDDDGEFSARYQYDTHGNMIRMPRLPLMRWDERDQLRATAQQVVNDGTPETTYYVYDAAGQRVRKVTERQNGTRMKERTYLGGFEIYREYNGNGSTITLERETLHIMDDKQRIALVETKTLDSQSPISNLQSLIRYQFGNHLGSASLELDKEGQVISYEEYYPYGSTSYQAGRSATEVSQKRYRYTGKERDEETGLYYHGARYYAAWLGRWTACDPRGLQAGINLYLYGRASPTRFTDPAGMQDVDYLEGGSGAGQGPPPPEDPNVRRLREEHEAIQEFQNAEAWWWFEDSFKNASEKTLEFMIDPFVSTAGAPTSKEDAARTAPRLSDARFAVNVALTIAPLKMPGGVSGLTRVGVFVATGAGAAIEGQVFEDVFENGEVSSPETYLSEAATGAAEGLVAGAIDRAVTWGTRVFGGAVGGLGGTMSGEAQPITLLSGKRLPVINPHFSPTITVDDAFQGATSSVARKIEANPELVGQVLSPKEINQMLANPDKWASVNYGKAIQRWIGRIGEANGFLQDTGDILIRDSRGRFLPRIDYSGVGPWEGKIFEVTTPDAVLSHMQRSYGTDVVYGLTEMPPSFRSWLSGFGW